MPRLETWEQYLRRQNDGELVKLLGALLAVIAGEKPGNTNVLAGGAKASSESEDVTRMHLQLIASGTTKAEAERMCAAVEQVLRGRGFEVKLGTRH